MRPDSYNSKFFSTETLKSKFKVSFKPTFLYSLQFDPKVALPRNHFKDAVVKEKNYIEHYFSIHPTKTQGNDQVFDVVEFKSELEAVAPQLQYQRDKTVLQISIPSPFGSRWPSGKMISHAITVLMDNKEKEIICYDPYVGKKKDDDKICQFHLGCKKIIESIFIDYTVSEYEAGMQNRGEMCCQFISEVCCLYFIEDKGFPTRSDLAAEWMNFAMRHNNSDVVKEQVATYTNRLVNNYMAGFLKFRTKMHDIFSRDDRKSQSYLNFINAFKEFFKALDTNERVPLFDDAEKFNRLLECQINDFIKNGKLQITSDNKYRFVQGCKIEICSEKLLKQFRSEINEHELSEKTVVFN